MINEDDRPGIDRLLAIMAALRTPGSGCPWDLEQTFETIAPYTIEEAYEVADAIARANMSDLKEELGDLLLQVVYHARIAQEDEHFDFNDVATAIAEKMIRRHPHVFGSDAERAVAPEQGFWERIKAEERAEKAGRRETTEPSDPASASPSQLDGVPIALPAMTRALKLQSKAARVGFDWPALGPVMAKMHEELGELDQALSAGSRADVADEFGDLLFVMVNVARHLDIDPEASLRQANDKFERRFRSVEQQLADDGRQAEDASLEDMDRLWDQAKRDEKKL